MTQALRTMGYDNVYGVCDAPSGFLRQLKNMTGRENLTCECFGLNHLSWFHNFRSGDEDVTEKVISHPKFYSETASFAGNTLRFDFAVGYINNALDQCQPQPIALRSS